MLKFVLFATIASLISVVVVWGVIFLYRRYKLLSQSLSKILVVLEEIKVNQEQLKLTQENLQVTQEQLQVTQQATQEELKVTKEEIQENVKENQEKISRLALQLTNIRETYDPVVRYADNWRRKDIRRDNLGGEALLSYKDRSVVFLHNSYYHFYYLAQALRRRGWDAVTVSYEDPINGINANYYHGEDINLFSPDPEKFRQNIEEFFADAKRRFQLLHFAGDGIMSFFPENWSQEHPEDIIEWRHLGKKVAYTISGCNSAVAQSTFAEWTAMSSGRPICDVCVWQNSPEICSDNKNLAWGRKVDTYCDVIFGETVPALDYLDSPKAIFEPVSMCLDPTVWYPELPVPEKFKIAREDGEFLVYHAVGNYDLRTQQNGHNIKGTHAVVEAVERLKSEGIPVKLIFVTDVKNIEVRYIQVQADVIVDQLNYGRYGATSREAMMLGKPTICYINKHESNPHRRLSCLEEVPLVSATEETIYEVLKNLLFNPEQRLILGKKSREYALKWHSADACAERYEQIYDRLMQGQSIAQNSSQSLVMEI